MLAIQKYRLELKFTYIKYKELDKIRFMPIY